MTHRALGRRQAREKNSPGAGEDAYTPRQSIPGLHSVWGGGEETIMHASVPRWVPSFLVGVLGLVPSAFGYEQREGTFSFGVQGQLNGLLSASGDEYEPFSLANGSGLDAMKAGLAVRIRIAIDRQSAFGFGFEAIGYERATSTDDLADFEVTARDTAASMHISAVSGEYYRYFHRKAKQTPYLVGGIGWFRPEVRFREIATRFPGSGVMLSFGGGLEHFFAPSVSLDISARGNGLFADGGHGIGAQIGIGIRFYHLNTRRR